MANCYEHCSDIQGGSLAVGDVLELESADLAIGFNNFFDDLIGLPLDLFVGLGALQHDLGGAEVLGAVHNGDRVRELGEEGSLFHGGVAAADNGNIVALEEEAIARSAGGYTAAG